MSSKRKDMQALTRKAVKQGFIDLGILGSGHCAVLAPNGERIVYAWSPSSQRAVTAYRANLRRHGFRE